MNRQQATQDLLASLAGLKATVFNVSAVINGRLTSSPKLQISEIKNLAAMLRDSDRDLEAIVIDLQEGAQ